MVVSITYDAKCKHCKYFKRYTSGKRVKHKCGLTDADLTLKSEICNKFELS